MRLTRLFEALDDRDQFGPVCGYCMQYANDVGDQDRFHQKHEQAEIVAERGAHETGGVSHGWRRQKYSDIFNIEMRRFGYVRQDSRGPWIDSPLKENLDDQDHFGPDCSYAGCAQRQDAADFHEAHEEAEQAAYNSEERRQETDVLVRQRIYTEVFIKAMAKHGYYPDYYSGSVWAKMPVKEALDDKDQFEPTCGWTSCAFRTTDDTEEFHAAHVAATAMAQRKAINDNDYRDRFHEEMNKRGYFYRAGNIANVPDWEKITFKEDLDDKDHFEPASDCAICPQYRGEDLENFHNAHTNAHNIALGAHNYQDWWANYNKIFKDEMNKLGYVRAGEWVFAGEGGYTPWVKAN